MKSSEVALSKLEREKQNLEAELKLIIESRKKHFETPFPSSDDPSFNEFQKKLHKQGMFFLQEIDRVKTQIEKIRKAIRLVSQS